MKMTPHLLYPKATGHGFRNMRQAKSISKFAAKKGHQLKRKKTLRLFWMQTKKLQDWIILN